MPEFQHVSHVAVTVTDLDRSKAWYTDVLAWQPMFDGAEGGTKFSFGAFSGGVLLGLRQHDSGSGDGFDPGRTGLDHLSFSVGTRSELDAWEKHFDEKGVTYTPT